MSGLSAESYLSVAYDLRPSKQVERRIMLDFFQRLSGSGVPCYQFRYTGMGSIHFIDHILFHKFLGLTKLVSVERDGSIRKRVHFNQPFNVVEIEIMEIGDYIPSLSKNEKHIVWLDYDYRLSEEMIEDVKSCSYFLSSGSFVLVTVDVEPSKKSGGPLDNYKYYKDTAKNLWDPAWEADDFDRSKLPLRVLSILGKAFQEGVSGRVGMGALPCFSFVYADGHHMATLGIQLGADDEREQLAKIKQQGATYLVLNNEEPPFCIDVPVLTRRERLYLESKMPSEDYRRASHTGISKDQFNKFSKVYRFLPSYAELLLG